MKKTVISGIIAAVIGVVALAPVSASAVDMKEADINGDGVVDVIDLATVRAAISTKCQIGKDGELLSHVVGDVDLNGHLDKVDANIIWELSGYPINDVSKYADVNDDGVIDVLDHSTAIVAIGKKSQIDKGGVVLDYKRGDLNHDGVVNDKDLEILKALV